LVVLPEFIKAASTYSTAIQQEPSDNQFSPEIDENQQLLVVDGMITDTFITDQESC
jgi:hypothetical protein